MARVAAAAFQQALKIVDMIMTMYFTLEVVIKVLTHGLWFFERAYLRDGFNCLDMVVAIVSLTGFIQVYCGTTRILR